MRIIDANINVISDDVVYLTITSKNVHNDSGDWLNFSKYTLRFRNLWRAMSYLRQMVPLIPDKDYHFSINIVRVS